MSGVLQFKRATAAVWLLIDPVLAQGELGYVTDLLTYKIGDGVTPWSTLPAIAISSEFGALTLNVVPDPGASPADKLYTYAHPLAQRVMLKMVGPSGLDTALQPFLGRNKIGMFCPPGNATTASVLGAYTTPTATGTATTRSVTTANLFTRMRRLGYVSAGTAGALAGARVAAAQITTGGASGAGFFKVIRFGFSDPVPVAGARTFVGVSSSTSAPTNVEPSVLTNAIGVGERTADTNLHVIYGGSAAQTPIDLGVNFPVGTSNTDPYELTLFAPPASTDVHYEVTRLNTGDVATGTLTASGGLALPPVNTLLTYLQAWRTNNATAAAVGLDIMSDYIETDY